MHKYKPANTHTQVRKNNTKIVEESGLEMACKRSLASFAMFLSSFFLFSFLKRSIY